MKRLKYLLLIPFAFIATRLHGDIIVIEPQPADICVKLTNLNEFPDIAVIGLSDCFALSKSNKAYRIKSNSCLKVYKPCPLSLYVIKLDYLKQNDLDKINWDKDKNVQKLNLTVKAKSFNTYDFSSVEIDFNLASKNGTIFYLYKTKMTYKYENERPDSVQYFKNDVVDPLKPISVSIEHGPR